jgi:hypothetical protein
MIRPGGLVRQATSRSSFDESAAPEQREDEATPASLPRRAAAPQPNGKAAHFRKAIGRLVLTRDLQIPGTNALGFRLIPTRKALGGEKKIPFVFRVRFTKQRLGLDLGGWF